MIKLKKYPVGYKNCSERNLAVKYDGLIRFNQSGTYFLSIKNEEHDQTF